MNRPRSTRAPGAGKLSRRRFLQTVGAAAACAACRPLLAALPTTRDSRPNFVLLLADDQNWNGLGVAMDPAVEASRHAFHQTPHLAKLAGAGVRFSRAYAPAPVCAPTRYSLQTGKSPAALHMTKAAPAYTADDGFRLIPPQHVREIAEEEVTVAELLRGAGYATAHYGKWHLRGGGPGRHGYDAHDGDTGNEDAERFGGDNPVDIFGMTKRACAFMDEQAAAGRPLFIQMSYHALHYPQQATKAAQEKYRKLMPGAREREVQIAAMTDDLDRGVGQLLAHLDRLGIADSTCVVYTSDNGGGGAGRGALSGGKGELREGGIRVPLIIRGPGVEAGAACAAPVVGFDLLPTFCEPAGIARLPAGVEGGSIAPLLADPKSGKVKRPHEELVFHFPHYQGRAAGPHSAIMAGPYKLLHYYEDDSVKLYDLTRDMGEQHDLAGAMPGRAAELKAVLARRLKALDAQMPRPNPNPDPAKADAARRRHEARAGSPQKPGKRRGGAGTVEGESGT